MGVSGTCGCGRRDHEGHGLAQSYCRSVQELQGSVFPSVNGVFQQDNDSCHMSRILLNWIQELTTEFQLKSWSPNSTDFNQIVHNWGIT